MSDLLLEVCFFIHVPRVTVGPLQVKPLSQVILCKPQAPDKEQANVCLWSLSKVVPHMSQGHQRTHLKVAASQVPLCMEL